MPGLFGGGSQKSTTTVQLRAPSAQEQELGGINTQIARLQFQQLQQAQAEQAAQAGSPLGLMQKQLETAATQNLLARLTGTSPVLSPEAQQRINTVYGASRQRGAQDLLRQAQELAGQRGLATSDSPIFGEALRQARDFQTQLGAAQAQSELNVGDTEANFNAAVASFQNQLRQQAFMNRLSLGQAQPASFGLQQNLFGQRLASAPRSMVGFGSPSGLETLSGLGQFAAGVGGLARGVGPFFGSSNYVPPYRGGYD